MASRPAALRVPAPIVQWWSSKSDGERSIVASLALLILVAVAWWGVWQPVTRDVEASRATLARTNAALADARRMTEEMVGLSRAAALPPDGDPRPDLERVLVQQNLRSALTQQDWKDGRARLVFRGVNYDALVAGLEALQRDLHLRIVEATLTARVEPGTVRAELVLAR
jgi:type II secretory pathway component PulM